MNDLSKCFKYYNELDDDLKNLVLSKVRNNQNKELLDDIINFKKQKECIYNKYLENGFEYTDSYDDNVNIHGWIENDLTAYYNNDIAYIDDIINSNIDKLSRQLCFKIKKEKKGETVAVYCYHLDITVNPISKINRYIGNLTISERDDFISKIN